MRLVLGLVAMGLALAPLSAQAQVSRLEELVDCAAYYGTMADVSLSSGERETGRQFEASAGYAFEAVMETVQNDPAAVDRLAQRLGTSMEQMQVTIAGDLGMSSILVQQYDETCRKAVSAISGR